MWPYTDVDDHRDAVLVGGVDERLEVGALAEALVDAEVADRQETPVDRRADVGQRHHLDGVDAQIGQVGQNSLARSRSPPNSAMFSS